MRNKALAGLPRQFRPHSGLLAEAAAKRPARRSRAKKTGQREVAQLG